MYDYHPNPNPNGNYPNANPNGNYQNPNPKRDIIYVVVVALFIAGLIAISVWASHGPAPPKLSVSRFDVSNFNLSSNSLTSDFSLSIAVRNPNKKVSIEYYEVRAAVLYKTDCIKSVIITNDDVIVETPVAPFNQSAGDVTDLEAELSVVGFYAEKRIRDLRFGVRVSLKVKFSKAGPLSSRKDHLVAFCNNIPVGLSSTTAGVGAMVGPARGCVTYL